MNGRYLLRSKRAARMIATMDAAHAARDARAVQSAQLCLHGVRPEDVITSLERVAAPIFRLKA
jgi:hypothetical protein